VLGSPDELARSACTRRRRCGRGSSRLRPRSSSATVTLTSRKLSPSTRRCARKAAAESHAGLRRYTSSPTVQEALCGCLLITGLTLRAGVVGHSGNSIAYSVDSWCVSKMPSCVRCVSAGGWQLDVDTPRCHPYHELISSPEARCAALRCASSEGCRSVHAAGGCGPPVQFGAAPYTCRVTASRCCCRVKPSCGGSCGVGRTRTRRSRTGRQSHRSELKARLD
jgi:hypothetical protein